VTSGLEKKPWCVDRFEDQEWHVDFDPYRKKKIHQRIECIFKYHIVPSNLKSFGFKFLLNKVFYLAFLNYYFSN
jgi:hypothetical protein